MNLCHENHATDQMTYDHYQENMRLSPVEQSQAMKMISMGANKKKMKMDLMNQRGGKPVSLKNLHNLQTKMQQHTKNSSTNDLQTLYECLSQIPRAKVRFIINQANEILGKYSLLSSLFRIKIPKKQYFHFRKRIHIFGAPQCLFSRKWFLEMKTFKKFREISKN